MFFHFRQNNSYGIWKGPAINVIIEAEDDEEANDLAEMHGLYFNGVDDGQDCPCCGDRWYEVWGKGNEVPSCYGEPVKETGEYGSAVGNGEFPSLTIFYKDGSEKIIR